MESDMYLSRQVSAKDLQLLADEAKDYAFCNGFVIGLTKTDVVGFAPACLFPSPFPEKWFQVGKEIQTSLNLLLHRVSSDITFLQRCLQKAAVTDDYLGRLMKILETVLEEGYKQNLTLGIFRMDYMLDANGDEIVGMKQIEMNTISTSFGSLASKIKPLQMHVLRNSNIPDIKYPDSNSLHEIANGLVSAWKAYGVPSAALLYVIESDVANIADQRLLEYTIYAIEPKIKILRHTFVELNSISKLKDYRLFVDNLEIAVVYYRTGYTPDQFENESAWSARLMFERSHAIQCPNIPLQLAGMKKIQQELTRDGVIEKFLPDVSPEVIKTIRTVFAGQFSLELSDEGERAVEKAIASPEKFVLKPQREGGGNNIFGHDIIEAFKEFKGQDREAFVLMELINPPVQKNVIVRKNQPSVEEVDIVGELGIYGVFLGDSENILVNSVAGHLLRCKEHGVNEGGVAMGYGALNMIYLV